MKDKRIVWIAGVMVALGALALLGLLFSTQNVQARQHLTAPVEEQPMEARPVSLPAEAPEEARTPALPIGPVPLPARELKAEEVVYPNWESGEEPGPADITEGQAVENAMLVAKTLFNIEDPTVMDVKFFKDMTGQRNSHWYIAFVEETLMINVDALTGNVCFADADKLFDRGRDYGFPLPGFKDYDPEQDEYKKLMDEIRAEIESGESEYLTATLEFAEKFLPGGAVKRTEFSAAHGDGQRHPAVGMDIEMRDGASYKVEWVKDGETGELLLYRLYAYPTWEQLCAGETYYADMLFWSIEENWAASEAPEATESPAVEPKPLPTPPPPDKLT